MENYQCHAVCHKGQRQRSRFQNKLYPTLNFSTVEEGKTKLDVERYNNSRVNIIMEAATPKGWREEGGYSRFHVTDLKWV